MSYFIRGIFTTESWIGMIFRILAIITACFLLPFSAKWFGSMAKSGLAVVAARNRDKIIQQYGLQDAKGVHFGDSGFLLDTAANRMLTYNFATDGVHIEMPFSKILNWSVHWREDQRGREEGHTIKFRTSDDTTPVFSIGDFASRQQVDTWDQRFDNMFTKT